MTELEALIKLLAFQLGENANLRNALVEALLAFMDEERQQKEQPTGRLSYLELLDQIEHQRSQAEQEGKLRLSVALQTLEEQIRDELRQSALALHQELRSGVFAPGKQNLKRVGLDVKDFPVGFPQDINLLTVSENYIKAVKDLHILQNHFPDSLSGLTQKITKEKQLSARWLRDIVLEALSSEPFVKVELAQFHRQYLELIQGQRTVVEQELASIIRETAQLSSSTSLHQLETWLQKYGSLASNVLKELSPAYRKSILKLLLRSRDYTGLEAVIALDPTKKEEKDLFETLMTLRFGESFLDALHAWKTWLRKHIDDAMQRAQTVNFWKLQFSYIPSLLTEHSSASQKKELEISARLQAKLLEELGKTDLKELLERRRSMMTAPEVQILEDAIQEIKAVSTALEFRVEEVVVDETQEESPVLDFGESGEGESELSPFVEGTIEAAVDFAIEGNLLESAIVSAIDKGAETFEERLTVSIGEDEEESRTPKTPPGRSRFFSKRKPLRVEEEPHENIWSEHIFPFVKENLVFVLAPGLIFIGLLLLVFTLWDKAAWIRYGLTPFMIVSVSYALSRIGVWLKGEEIKSDSPIAFIQSVAVFLAPMSLLFVALLSVDPQVSLLVRVLWGIVLSVALLTAWYYIFALAIRTISRKMADIHTYTLLLLNVLLLLLPVSQLTMSPEAVGLNLEGRAIIVAGFYLGFLVLCWSMRRGLGKMMEKEMVSSRIPTVFYSVTCLGTFVLVWGLTHARLLLLPQPHTYAPLLLIFSFLISMIEFQLLDIREQTDRITSLSYAAYFFIGLGVLLSIGHDYVRVVSLLLAGLVWFYQAVKLQDARHFNVSIVILTGAFSVIALVRDFPAPFFPYLTLLVILGLYLVSLTFPHEAVTLLAAGLSPIYMSFAFVVSILWQWAEELPPFPYGIAFALFGIFSLYLGAKTDKLIHVHAGAGYLVAALPYLGSVDMNLYTLEGNTLVFGLAMVGIFWTMVSSGSQNKALRDSRSTVLWNIGILAFCVMCLRVILGESVDFSTNAFLQFQILSGPVIIAGLMLLAGYFTRSYIPVYLALVVLVIIFPEIKDRFDIPMYSGLGSTFSGIGFLMLALVLQTWKHLYQTRDVDLIWRKKTFPFQAENSYYLYATPVVVAAFFLLTRVIFVTYPKNVFWPQMPFGIKTCLAVVLAGTAYHFFSVWFGKTWFSYLGFIAVCFGIIHSCYVGLGTFFDELFLPLFVLAGCVYCESLSVVSSKILLAEKASLINTPFRHLKYFVIWVAALGTYLFYSLYYGQFYGASFFYYWLPLVLYLCVVSGRLAWKKNLWLCIVPVYLLFWQFVTLIATRGDFLPYLLYPQSPFYFSTSLMTLGVVSSFFFFERFVTKEKFRVLSPLLWMSLILLLLFSLLSVAAFYLDPDAFPGLNSQLIIWALVSFVVGRFLNLGPLWLWSAFLIYLVCLSFVDGGNLSFIDRRKTQLYAISHPFTFGCVAIVLSGISLLTARVKWLYEHKFSCRRAQIRLLSPSFLFSVAAYLVVICAFLQATKFDPQFMYRHEWLTVAGLFLSALPALFAAHQLGFSRHFLFGVPYTLAWVALILAVRFHFPQNSWFVHLQTPHLISIGFFGAILTAAITDAVLPCQDRAYRFLKLVVASGVMALIMFTYLTIRDVELLSWQWLITSGMLSLGVGLYFRYLAEKQKGSPQRNAEGKT